MNVTQTNMDNAAERPTQQSQPNPSQQPYPGYYPQPRRKRRGCLIAALIGVGVYFLLSTILGLCMIFLSSPMNLVEDNTIYRLELKGEVVEQASEQIPFEAVLSELYGVSEEYTQSVGLDDILSNIRLAKTDDRIRGIYLEGGQMQVGLASAKAIRDALIDFKSSGKFIIAHADNYGEMSYYIASVADQIYFNPSGMLEWHGFGAIKLYYPRLMEKLEVKMNVMKVGSFKSAVEPFICTEMSDEDKEQTMQYLNGAWNEVCQAVSTSRGISVEQLNAYADELVELMPQEKYTEYNFVDSLVYGYDMKEILREMVGTKDYHLKSTAALANISRETSSEKNEIAVLYAAGEITDEAGEGIVGKKMIKTIQTIAKNENVKAVVLRVNSPGGSANASEQIWYAVQSLRKQGIPVVVSMGDYAASGGYYISCGADYIYAEPTTLTGSIGIFGLVPDLSGSREAIGVDIDAVGTNKFSGSHMILKGMTNDERQLMQTMVERGYDLFTKRCADGRGMSQDSIKAIGEGRVWIGSDAVSLGLVDELGNIDDAIVKAAELAQIEHYKMSYYPEKKDFIEELMLLLDPASEEEQLLVRIKKILTQQGLMARMPEQIIL